MAQEAPASEGTPAKPEDKKPEGEPSKPEANTAAPESTESPKTFDEQYVKTLRAENAERRVETQALKEKLEELEERDKSAVEKAQTKVTKAEQAKAEAEAKLVRYEVAADKNVPAEVVEFLKGNTREELEASADKLLKLVKSRNDNDKPDFDGGAREPAGETDPEAAHTKLVADMLLGNVRT